MGHIIALAGKGGVGKTTLCGLLIQYLSESGKGLLDEIIQIKKRME